MAFPKISLIFFFLLAKLIIHSEAGYPDLKQTQMTVHIQDIAGGENATTLIVTGIPGRVWSYSSFGTHFVTDNPVTRDADKGSPEIGRGQGIFVTSSFDGSSMHVMFSIVFTNKDYGGSTLEIQGRSIQAAAVSELSVVGGTDKFRFAKGYATFEIVQSSPSIPSATVRCNLTFLHY